jgi:hypothetical protein
MEGEHDPQDGFLDVAPVKTEVQKVWICLDLGFLQNEEGALSQQQ